MKRAFWLITLISLGFSMLMLIVKKIRKRKEAKTTV
jgi:hypothetical protein